MRKLLNDPNWKENTNNISGWRKKLAFVSICIIIVSLYLINYYYKSNYPDSITFTSLCEISSYFSCDLTTFSSLSNIFGVPISIFGFALGIIFLSGAFIHTYNFNNINLILSVLNVVLCVFLLLYSVVFINGICPACFIYYILSSVVCYIYLINKNNILLKKTKLSLKNLLPHAIIVTLSIVSAGFYTNHQELVTNISENIQHIFEDVKKNKITEKIPTSDLSLYSVNGNFNDSPLRISIFSDFKCQFCKILALEIVPKIISKYKNILNLQVFLYPIDHECNKKISQPHHQDSCYTSYAALCSNQSHDYFFENQKLISKPWVKKTVENLKIQKCFSSKLTHQKLDEMIKLADELNINETPVLIINEYKIVGILPFAYLVLLIDKLLKEEGHN